MFVIDSVLVAPWMPRQCHSPVASCHIAAHVMFLACVSSKLLRGPPRCRRRFSGFSLRMLCTNSGACRKLYRRPLRRTVHILWLLTQIVRTRNYFPPDKTDQPAAGPGVPIFYLHLCASCVQMYTHVGAHYWANVTITSWRKVLETIFRFVFEFF